MGCAWLIEKDDDGGLLILACFDTKSMANSGGNSWKHAQRLDVCSRSPSSKPHSGEHVLEDTGLLRKLAGFQRALAWSHCDIRAKIASAA